MRHTYPLCAIGVAALLTGCGGGSSSLVVAQNYYIGGSISGLSGSIVLQDDDGNDLTLTTNGTFKFSEPGEQDSLYDVTVAVQPTGQICSVTNGSGRLTGTVSNIAIACSTGTASTVEWTWRDGSDLIDAPGSYGTEGTAASGNTPGARKLPATWTDSSGNFWLFGGSGADSTDAFGLLNDLWKYSPTARQWTWVGGSSTTAGAAASYGTGTPPTTGNPGPREGAATWTDASGNLWLFGGDGLASSNAVEFNDLWKCNSAGVWTWVGGPSGAGGSGSYGTQGTAAASNLPPARTNAISWTDSAGNFWLFGGAQFSTGSTVSAVFDDLWRYSPTSGEWTWVGGSQTPDAAGVYGTKGTAAASNLPGARMGGNAWVDSSGNFWLFGGLGLQGSNSVDYNDLWKYDPTSLEWTWVGGSNSTNAAGVYGTAGVGVAGNQPGARVTAVSWQDSSGNFWLFGGFGYDLVGDDNDLNDLWEYIPTAGVWTWISGSSYVTAVGIYGTQNTASSSNTPGAREQAVGWLDSSGNFWLFGGFGFDGSGNQYDLNDLWSFTPTP